MAPVPECACAICEHERRGAELVRVRRELADIQGQAVNLRTALERYRRQRNEARRELQEARRQLKDRPPLLECPRCHRPADELVGPVAGTACCRACGALADLDQVRDEYTALSAKYIALVESVVSDYREGRAEVDKAHREHGYESLRFADVRHGWLFSTTRIRAWLRKHAPEVVNGPVQPAKEPPRCGVHDDKPVNDQ